MKIGILTFHCEINYGALLQCWALQSFLEGLGHEVVVIDRWWTEDNIGLSRGYDKWTFRRWLVFAVRSLLGLGDFGLWLRCRKTKRFIGKYLRLTPFHFVNWAEAPRNLGVDVVIVGSDQVWHCGDWGEPSAYLLEGMQSEFFLSAIAYAASFGMKELPFEYVDIYKTGLHRFRAISCREKEGVAICAKLGFDAVHVIDPTLLIDTEQWRRLSGMADRIESRKRLVCYFMQVNVETVVDSLQRFAESEDCIVEVFANDGALFITPRSISGMIFPWVNTRVRVHRSADPREFVKSFSSATWVITDSFHGLMFSTIFDCNARFLRPTDPARIAMFARIDEFVSRFISGSIYCNSVKSALDSLVNGVRIGFDRERLSGFREFSAKWLSGELNR